MGLTLEHNYNVQALQNEHKTSNLLVIKKEAKIKIFKRTKSDLTRRRFLFSNCSSCVAISPIEFDRFKHRNTAMCSCEVWVYYNELFINLFITVLFYFKLSK